jgi:transposase
MWHGLLTDVNITRIELPACSPDLNPIEHFWFPVGRNVRNRVPTPASLTIRNFVKHVWKNENKEKIKFQF